MQDPTIARLAEKNCQQAQIIEQARRHASGAGEER